MKKIITALKNKKVNEKLKEYNNIEIIMNDIQYQEGIFEALEIYPEIDYIILSELLPGEKTIEELVEKIKQTKIDIKMIIILEKENKKLENYLISKGNIKIFYNNLIEIKEIVEIINDKKEDLEKEIQELKKIIFEKEEINEKNNKEKLKEEKDFKNIKNNKEKILITEEEKEKIENEIEEEYKSQFIKYKIINKFKKIVKKDNEVKNTKTIIIAGVNGVGKSVFTVNIAKTLEKQKNNILIIDFDYINNSIETLFEIKNKNTEKQKENKNTKNIIEKNIIKITSKIDLISRINLLFFYKQEEINIIEFIKSIKEIKNKYDYIIIDIGTKKYNNLNLILNEAQKIILITEANILQIKKTKNFLNDNIKDAEKEKIYILFNKIEKFSLALNTLKSSFKEYNILGRISIIKNSNLLINNKMKYIFLNKKIKKQYNLIAKKIEENENKKQYYLEKIEK